MSNGMIVLLSGGLDSSTLLVHLVRAGVPVRALAVHYGQRHARELHAARVIATQYAVACDVLDLSPLGALLVGSSQTDPTVPVPHGHYAAASMAATIVPNRNAILLSVAAAVAIAQGVREVAYAAHAGDHFIYPDCRPPFVGAMQTALQLANDAPDFAIVRPFLTWTKAAIAERAYALGVPIADTWSCYEGGAVHCGRCGTCVERREALGVNDPTIYAER